MKRGRLLFLVVLLCLSLVAVPVSAQEKAVPLPKRVGEEMGKAAVPGTWYLADTPPDVDDSKPPIVFVQGLRGSAESWWGETPTTGPMTCMPRRMITATGPPSSSCMIRAARGRACGITANFWPIS